MSFYIFEPSNRDLKTQCPTQCGASGSILGKDRNSIETAMCADEDGNMLKDSSFVVSEIVNGTPRCHDFYAMTRSLENELLKKKTRVVGRAFDQLTTEDGAFSKLREGESVSNALQMLKEYLSKEYDVVIKQVAANGGDTEDNLIEALDEYVSENLLSPDMSDMEDDTFAQKVMQTIQDEMDKSYPKKQRRGDTAYNHNNHVTVTMPSAPKKIPGFENYALAEKQDGTLGIWVLKRNQWLLPNKNNRRYYLNRGNTRMSFSVSELKQLTN